jgi:hypothetical protein
MADEACLLRCLCYPEYGHTKQQHTGEKDKIWREQSQTRNARTPLSESNKNKKNRPFVAARTRPADFAKNLCGSPRPADSRPENQINSEPLGSTYKASRYCIRQELACESYRTGKSGEIQLSHTHIANEIRKQNRLRCLRRKS